MPTYWAGALLGLLLVAAEGLRPSGNSLLTWNATTNLSDVAARLAGISGIWPREILSGNGPLNTVGVELVLYVLYPIFWTLAARGRWLALGLGAAGLQLVALWVEPLMNPFVLFSGVLVMALLWFLGAWAAELRATREWRVHGAWAMVVWILFLAVKGLPRFYGQSLLKQAVFGACCFFVIGWLTGRERNGSGQHSVFTRVSTWLGGLSYALYAVHAPATFLVSWALLSVGKSHFLLQLAGAISSTTLAAIVVHYAVERRYYQRTTRETVTPRIIEAPSLEMGSAAIAKRQTTNRIARLH